MSVQFVYPDFTVWDARKNATALPTLDARSQPVHVYLLYAKMVGLVPTVRSLLTPQRSQMVVNYFCIYL